MESILIFDYRVFEWINQGFSSPFMDWLMPVWRNKYFWIPLYLFLILFFVLNFKKTGLVLILGLFITVGISDLISSKIIKPNVERLRPCNDQSLEFLVIQRVHCGSGYSFPSSHAANHFAFATFLGFFLFRLRRIWTLAFFLWALSISIAQVYVGVHFPIDITMGALLGILIGGLLYLISRKWIDLKESPRKTS